MKIDIYSQSGEKKGQIEVPDSIFGASINHSLVHQALLRELSNRRRPIAHVKTKGEVRGGGKKPWKQKHTGRARQGSTRSPHWRGGGKSFGPRNDQNFMMDMPKKQRRKALFSVLSAKMKDQQIFAIEKYETETPKTKEIVSFIKKLPAGRDMLFVLGKNNSSFVKSCRNVPNVKTILVNFLNIHDILKYEKIGFLKEALGRMENLYLEKTESAS